MFGVGESRSKVAAFHIIEVLLHFIKVDENKAKCNINAKDVAAKGWEHWI